MSPVAGTIPYDDEDVPTAYQPVPEGFSVEHDAATQVQPGLQPEPMADSERTRVVPPPEEKKAKPERPAPPSVSPASGESATVVQPLEEFLANARAQQSAPHHAAPEMPPAAGAPPGMMPPAAGSPAPQGAVGVYVQPPEPTVPAMGPASAYAAGLMPGGQGQPHWQQTPGGVGPGAVPPGAAPQGAPPGPKGSPVDDIKVKIETAWRDASPVRRVLFFLMPLMIVALIAHVLLTARRNRLAAEYAAAQASASALLASASAAPSASAPPTASAVPTVAPPSTPSSAPPQPPENPPEVEKPPEEKLAKGEVTDERKAVDAVARGDLDKAIELYSALAKAHPDEPAYAAAVEILQKKKGAR